KLTRRGEEGVHSRPTACQGSNFGPGSDKLAFQTCQLRPPCENDILKIVLSRSPTHQGKMWPRTESTNVIGFGLLCQPQICLAISFRGGNREARENNQAGAGREIAERINLFPAATAQDPSAEQEQGDIRTQPCCQLMPRGKFQ